MISDQLHLNAPEIPAPSKKRQWPASRKGHRHPMTTEEGRRPRVDPDSGRMDLLESLDLRDAIEHRANRVRVTALERRVLSAVLRWTVRRGRLTDSVSHAYLARFADCHPKEVGNALRALVACGMVRYTPGDTVVRTDGEGYRQTYSQIAVVVPPRWETFRHEDWKPEPVGEGKTFPGPGRNDIAGPGKENPSGVGEGKTFSEREGKTLPGEGRKDLAHNDTDGTDTDSADTDGVAAPTPLADSLRSRPGAVAGHGGEHDDPLGWDGWTWDRVTSVRAVVNCLHANAPQVGQELFSADRRREVINGLSTLYSGTPLQPREALYLAAVWAGQTNYAYANHVIQRITRFRDRYEVADTLEALVDALPAEVVGVGLEHGEQVRDDLTAARAARDVRMKAGA